MYNPPIDTSNYNINTPVLVSINERGVYIPELKGYPPIRTYCSIENVITIMNRGITVEFPNQSEKKEVSKKIEDIMLDYEERKQIIREKRGIEVGTNINQAMDLIQNMNDSTLVKGKLDTAKTDRADKVFDYSVQTEKIYKDLSNTEFMAKVLNDDDPKNLSAEDRLNRADIERKSRTSIADKRKEELQDLCDQTESLRKLYQDAKYVEADLKYHEELDLSESIVDFNTPVAKNPFYHPKKEKDI